MPQAETVDVETAARRIGISRGLAYQLARTNQFPVPVLRLGRRLLIPVASLDKLLGCSEEQDGVEA